jgi:hypothetical protein
VTIVLPITIISSIESEHYGEKTEFGKGKLNVLSAQFQAKTGKEEAPNRKK